MKRFIIFTLIAALLAGTWSAYAATKAEPAPLAQKETNSSSKTPGMAAATALSTITGVAISPLLGVSAVGAYTYFQTPKENRGSLSWYAQPWFWMSAFVLVGLCFAKDTAGTALPSVLKKPLDIADAVENKISGLVAVGAFVPMVASVFPSLISSDHANIAAPWFMAVINPAGLLNFILVPIAMVSFVIVWLAAHSINILILLSPFTTVDAALKSFRLFLLSFITGGSLMDPMLGAGISLIIIFIAYFIAGWSFRVTALGSIYIWDALSLRRTRTKPQTNEVWGFLYSEISKVPIRTYGKLVKDAAGRMVFHYRPWMILPEKTLVLPVGEYAVGEGLINSYIVKTSGEDEYEVVTLPPRYRSHEQAVANAYELAGVREIGFMKGFNAFIRALFGGSSEPARV
ncbi:MAG TPA: hypothetical protein VGH19_03255 [Verrucomicrobiae bacterium]